MPPDPEQTARLRELHDEFAWKVNAAVAEGRDDLIERFSEEYVEMAVRMLTGGPAAGRTACGREDCPACTRPRATRPRRRRRGSPGAAGVLGWLPRR